MAQTSFATVTFLRAVPLLPSPPNPAPPGFCGGSPSLQGNAALMMAPPLLLFMYALGKDKGYAVMVRKREPCT